MVGHETGSVTDLSGDYDSWAAAVAASTGYEAEGILEKTRSALLKVKRGEAAYERDSVLFDNVEYSWPILAGLMSSAAQQGGHLSVLDFGGSLGSTYFQNRRFLSRLVSVRWNVVEQARHVEIGALSFADDQLRFHASLQDCIRAESPKCAVLSSVLQYIESPDVILAALEDCSVDMLLIDRTPFWAGDRDRLCVQTVPPDIYSGSYPSWIFSRERFLSRIPADWEILTTFDSPDRLTAPVEVRYQGVIIVRKSDVCKSGLRHPVSSSLDQY